MKDQKCCLNDRFQHVHQNIKKKQKKKIKNNNKGLSRINFQISFI